MNRALSLRLALTCVVLAVLVSGQSVLGSPPSTEPSLIAVSDGPNIVLITTDDQALTDLRWMPKTRRLLGDGGATFTSFLAPQPLCCPARAQLLTGQYAHNNGVHNNSGTNGGYQRLESETALPVWLQKVGYRTAFVGKYLNGYRASDGVEPGWDSWNPTLTRPYRGFTQFDEGELVRPSGYHTDYVTRQSTGSIEELASAEQPFFLWTSFYAPHGICAIAGEVGCSTPPRVASRHVGRYRNVRAPALDSPSFNERDVSDKPRLVVRRGRVDPEKAQRLFSTRLQALASVDEGVAAIVHSLQDAGELDDTVIVFTSDNGFLNGEHRWTGKNLAYEESLRVPMLMRGPGIPAGVERSQISAMIDLAPTFADLARARAEVEVDGASLMAVARTGPRPVDRPLLVQAGIRGPDNRGLGWLYRGVRTNRYTFVHWLQSGFVELYDRRRDPYQLNNVAAMPRYAPVLADLAQRTDELGDCTGQSCRPAFRPVTTPLPR